ncbi:MAG: UvrD-helicase domain-containing protein, partial [Thermoleophilia bacterium]|nr:UvrD-helicase domain-containing protein [Thermoleophilia bacterium]
MELTSGIRRRVVVYNAPSASDLLEAAAAWFPEVALATSAPSKSMLAAQDVVPVFWLPEDRDDRTILHEIVFLLVPGFDAYVVGTRNTRQHFKPAPIELAAFSRLDREDIRAVLRRDSLEANYDSVDLLGSELTLTPIERLLSDAMTDAGIEFTPQVQIGPFIADFVIRQGNRRLVVEADGKDFHDADRDAQRDESLTRHHGVERVLRFTGSQIWRDADACVRAIENVLDEASPRTRSTPGLELDNSQRQAVTHGTGPSRVLAPAGAGKTRVLTSRVEELVQRGVNPSQILVLAFNKKAADQVIDRFEVRGVPVAPRKLFGDEAGVRCVTFHAFGYRLHLECLQRRPDILNDGKLRKLMEEAIKRAGVRVRGTKQGTDPVAQCLTAYRRAAADLCLPASINVEFEYVGEDEPSKIPFELVHDEFEKLCLAGNAITFDDMVTNAVRVLLADPQLRSTVQRRFTHILVDEFQDLNEAQLVLIEILSRPDRELYVVGDDDQLIYGWRHANLRNILGFEARHPMATTYTLSTNYRSAKSIVRTARRVIDGNTGRVFKDIQPFEGQPEGVVQFIVSGDWQDRAQRVAEFLTEQAERWGEWRETAVLCRLNAQLPLIASALDAADIPRTRLLKYRLFTDRSMRLLRSYIDVVNDESGVEASALVRTLRAPNKYCKKDLADEVVAASRPWETLLARCSDMPDWHELPAFVERVKRLHRRRTTLDPIEFLDEICVEFGLLRHWEEQVADADEPDQADPLALLDLVKLHADSLDTVPDLVTYWDERVAAEESGEDQETHDNLDREDNDHDAVVLSTIHKSKGREYGAVVIWDYWMKTEGRPDPEVEEERRVFYVGMTRARRNLLVTVDENRGAHMFVKEAIAPPQDGEHERGRDRLAKIATRTKELQADLGAKLAEQASIESGEKLRQLEQAAEELKSDAAERVREVSETSSEIERTGVVARLFGRKARLERHRLKLERELGTTRDRAAAVSGDAAFLEQHPE